MLCSKRAFLLMVLAILASSCTPKVKNMVPDIPEPYPRRDKSMAVGDVGGGEDTDVWIEGSKVDGRRFNEALAKALRESQMFEQKPEGQNPDYWVNAFIMTQDQPAIGLDMTASILVQYTIVHVSSGDTVWQKEINTSYTATFFSCCVGGVRLRRANEGAVRANIKRFLDEAAMLDL